jgi:hypothetical protein
MYKTTDPVILSYYRSLKNNKRDEMSLESMRLLAMAILRETKRFTGHDPAHDTRHSSGYRRVPSQLGTHHARNAASSDGSRACCSPAWILLGMMALSSFSGSPDPVPGKRVLWRAIELRVLRGDDLPSAIPLQPSIRPNQASSFLGSIFRLWGRSLATIHHGEVVAEKSDLGVDQSAIPSSLG